MASKAKASEEKQTEQPSAVIDKVMEFADSKPFGENGPTQAQIDAWKKEHGSIHLAEYHGGEIYIYRKISRSEYSALTRELRTDPRAADEMWFESYFVSRVLLWPENITVDELNETMEAGLASSLYNQISVICKFNTVSEPIEL
tara:strand:+ start:189 stop:620 length:432 start_codon:yes stop_codon:yes gene_type:complete